MLNDRQAMDVFESYMTNSPDHALRAAITRAKEWRAELEWMIQQRTSLHREIERLHRLCREGFNADTR